MGVLSTSYTILHEWTGAKYLGINLDWDYILKKVHTSMLGYVEAAIVHFDHPPPKRPQHQPYPHVKPGYGQKVQYTKG